jgi:hypothetical protein
MWVKSTSRRSSSYHKRYKKETTAQRYNTKPIILSPSSFLYRSCRKMTRFDPFALVSTAEVVENVRDFDDYPQNFSLKCNALSMDERELFQGKGSITVQPWAGDTAYKPSLTRLQSMRDCREQGVGRFFVSSKTPSLRPRG